jgi:alkylation response protein AidB-like acyl-CoA dehydrogenase
LQTAELAFDDCRVAIANRLGGENAGMTCLMSELDLERASRASRKRFIDHGHETASPLASRYQL